MLPCLIGTVVAGPAAALRTVLARRLAIVDSRDYAGWAQLCDWRDCWCRAFATRWAARLLRDDHGSRGHAMGRLRAGLSLRSTRRWEPELSKHVDRGCQ